MTDNTDCIFCLCDGPRTIQHCGPCKCRPHIHQRCINKWYTVYPNQCPICRVNYENIGNNITDINEALIVNDNRENDDRVKRFAIFFIVLILFRIIFSKYDY
jgi:hypothetical protein